MKKVVYVKKIPKKIEKFFNAEKDKKLAKERQKKLFYFFFKFFPSLFIIGGVAMIAIVIYPIFLYQFQYIPNTLRREMVKPIKLLEDYEIKTANEDNLNKEETFAIINKVDTTNAKTWFPNAEFVKSQSPKISNYTLSIPKLGIDNADVEVNSDDLKKSLVHYPESALPGELGNPVIFGHSTLPIFYNPKNYETIFSTLPEIKKGDKIIARVDGIEFTYVVYNLFTVDPTEIDVLAQKYDKYDMSLITCVPPGTKWKRLIVKARLKEN